MAKKKYYVVWKGVSPGIYDSWTDCQLQIKGYEGAQYKSFSTREEAEEAMAHTPFEYINRSSKKESYDKRLPDNFDMNTLAVDAACSGNPGPMEYRGVYLLTGQQIFHLRPIFGTEMKYLLSGKQINTSILHRTGITTTSCVHSKSIHIKRSEEHTSELQSPD